MLKPDTLIIDPSVPIKAYRDGFGNWCTRMVALEGETRIQADTIVHDSGRPDRVEPWAQQHAVHNLPDHTLVYLLGSRYCETDSLSETAWALFDKAPHGWARVQAICDFVHKHIQFGYEHARRTRSAVEAYHERQGVCRDFAHLAITFCRCMNIPARYCTGYLGDIGVPPSARRWTSAPGSKSSWVASGTPSTRQQHPSDRPHPDRPRP